jgi:hypothetical protein
MPVKLTLGSLIVLTVTDLGVCVLVGIIEDLSVTMTAVMNTKINIALNAIKRLIQNELSATCWQIRERYIRHL